MAHQLAAMRAQHSTRPDPGLTAAAAGVTNIAEVL
jgi:hypothetical protein